MQKEVRRVNATGRRLLRLDMVVQGHKLLS